MWFATLWDQSMQPLQWGVTIAASLAAAALDVTSGRIPNRLTGPMMLGGLAFATIVGGREGLADSAAGAAAMAVAFVMLFLLVGGGAGDAKLMAAIGTWLGVINGLFALAAVLAAGAVMAVAMALAARRLRAVMSHLACTVLGLGTLLLSRQRLYKLSSVLPQLAVRQTMPYAVAIFVGVCGAAAGVTIWRVWQ